MRVKDKIKENEDRRSRNMGGEEIQSIWENPGLVERLNGCGELNCNKKTQVWSSVVTGVKEKALLLFEMTSELWDFMMPTLVSIISSAIRGTIYTEFEWLSPKCLDWRRTLQDFYVCVCQSFAVDMLLPRYGRPLLKGRHFSKLSSMETVLLALISAPMFFSQKRHSKLCFN